MYQDWHQNRQEDDRGFEKLELGHAMRTCASQGLVSRACPRCGKAGIWQNYSNINHHQREH